MAIPSGVGAQLMTGEESTHGTAVTVDRGYEFVSESLSKSIERLESAGLRAGKRVQRSDRWAPGLVTVGGDITMELANKSFGRWLKHMFGGVASAQPNAGSHPTVWEHTFTPGDLPAGQTIQVGRPSTDGTAQPFTYEGCVVESWELAARVGEICSLAVTINGEDEVTATGLQTASYPSALSLLVFTQATLEIAAAAIDVTEVTLTGSNSLKTDRNRIGSPLRKRPVETNMREYTGEMSAYFDSLTAYNRFINGTEATLELLIIGGVISGPFNFALEVTCNVRFDGTTPQVGGPDEIMQPLPFKCVGDTSAGAITAVYRTTDTTP